MTEIPKRKRNRLKDFDYSDNGSYFVTICVKDKKCVLSSIAGGDDFHTPQVKLKKFGVIVERNIFVMQEIYQDIAVEKYVIMPNHIHFLISIYDENRNDGAPRSSPPTNTLSIFVTALKKYTNKAYGENIWQRSFHDHIIRDQKDYNARWQYIDENPKKWLMGKDEYYA